MALERELDTFRRELPKLLAVPGNQGRFVLIHGETVAGLYQSFDDGVAAGYDLFGLDSFMVKEVIDHEKPGYFSRNLKCRT
ncbi:MAG: hypothetical protein JWO38_5000 [Gemmataceae bacterium]|nr:hypothetical protein [Gemmataceae bacterium]